MQETSWWDSPTVLTLFQTHQGDDVHWFLVAEFPFRAFQAPGLCQLRWKRSKLLLSDRWLISSSQSFRPAAFFHPHFPLHQSCSRWGYDGVVCVTTDYAMPAEDRRNPKGDGKKGTAKKNVINCRQMSRNVLWHFMTFYDVYDALCQWEKETEIVIKCRKVS